MAERPHRRGLSLRRQLLLVSLSMLAIPWVGVQFVREMEAFLRQGQETALLDTAHAVATVLHERPALFRGQADLLRSLSRSNNGAGATPLYARHLHTPIQLDGYVRDWSDYMDWAQHYGRGHVLQTDGNYSEASLSFDHIIGQQGRYLYALFMVQDDKPVYRAPSSLRLDQGDHLRIALESPQGELQRYQLATRAPGWVNAHRMPNDVNNPMPVGPEVRIKGEWQETEYGYNLEIRIPLDMLGPRLAFAIADVDDPVSRRIETVIGTSGTQRLEELGAVLRPSSEIEQILKGLARSDARLWVIDTEGTVLALTGKPHVAHSDTLSLRDEFLQAVFGLVLKPGINDPEPASDKATATHLQGREITAALHGQAMTRWRGVADQQAVILSAAYPVRAGDEVIGAVIAEQGSQAILSLQNKAMERLTLLSLLVFVGVTALLLAYASLLSWRIRRLRNAAERAIGQDGRFQGEMQASLADDEIGDLSRGFAELMERLRQYTHYLESMAGKLSHELRTPLSVVRSSLDNLEMQELPEQAGVYTQRAREGVQRLSELMSRMSEATRLEQALQAAEREDFELNAVVSGCVEGYRLAYPAHPIVFANPERRLPMLGVPELIAQLLDKLVSNAVDFSDAGSRIEIRLGRDAAQAILEVANSGPSLPDEDLNHLFDSLVSLRDGNDPATPHLGLGLYIVRLITEFHGGRVSAHHNPQARGAVFRVELPLSA